MTKIEIINITQGLTHFEVSFKMYFDIPTAYAPGGVPIANIEKVVPTFSKRTNAPPGNYNIEILPSGTKIIVVNDVESGLAGITVPQAQAALTARYNAISSFLGSLALSTIDQAIGAIWDGTSWLSANTMSDNTIPESNDYARNVVVGNGSAGGVLSVTLPAVPGKTHAIAHINIIAYNTVARTGNATPVLVTTSNLNSLGWVFASAGAIGTSEFKITEPSVPLAAAQANTNTVITCPATNNVRWFVTVIYDLI